ncbi:MAG: GTPase [Nitrospinae bacterium CG11_big_fil_rev_8_21_14_0_20_45_15]|nr:MAG: GTPase [Nitrospinae bacterium CG11_big_fil_rev_8_21_14_0_20_45_15]
MMAIKRKRVLIMGAAGRDFHTFNTTFRNDSSCEVVAFTATQIPGIEKKIYPAALSGNLYPNGIPIHPESELDDLIRNEKVDVVVFAYSDVSHEYIMHKASSVIAAGADFWLLGTAASMIPSSKKIISICAVRTGCGKSQTSRKVAQILKNWDKNIVAVRHAMPYGNLEKQKVQRYATLDDLTKHDCTIEEMEEYEPYIDIGIPIYAGVDYEAILREAEKEADIIIWDGGNNDFSFFLPDLEIVVMDPHRPGDELSYFPGEVNLLRADVLIINKVDTADYGNVLKIRNNISHNNPTATIIEAASPIYVEQPQQISGQRVLVVEDGPTLTHGGMKYGAGTLAAQRYGAKEIVDPRPWLVGTLIETFEKYPDIGHLLPAMGYGKDQMNDLQATINSADCDLVIIGTPIDLTRIIKINKPSVRVTYELQEIGYPTLESTLKDFLNKA